jgi:hypothetical protein
MATRVRKRTQAHPTADSPSYPPVQLQQLERISLALSLIESFYSAPAASCMTRGEWVGYVVEVSLDMSRERAVDESEE